MVPLNCFYSCASVIKCTKIFISNLFISNLSSQRPSGWLTFENYVINDKKIKQKIIPKFYSECSIIFINTRHDVSVHFLKLGEYHSFWVSQLFQYWAWNLSTSILQKRRQSVVVSSASTTQPDFLCMVLNMCVCLSLPFFSLLFRVLPIVSLLKEVC